MVSAHPRVAAIDQPLPGMNGRHRTALHIAASTEKPDQMRDLLQRGASVDIRDLDGFTPLHEAAMRGHLVCIDLLLQAGADPNAQASGMDDVRPLDLAALDDRQGPVLMTLVRAGADPFILNQPNVGKSAAYIEGARCGVDREVLRLLDADRDGSFRQMLASHAAAHLGDGGSQAERAATWLTAAAAPLTRTDWDLIDHVRIFGDCRPDSGALPTDFDWREVEHHPVETLIGCMPGGRSAWSSWWADEIASMPGQWDRLATDARFDERIICSGPRRGDAPSPIQHIWDGWHRTAAAIIRGMPTIPAIVGVERR